MNLIKALKIRDLNMENYSSLLIGGKQFSSRLLVGTGKYKSTQDMVESLSNSETEIITVLLEELKMIRPENLLEKINWENTGCFLIQLVVLIPMRQSE